MKYWYLVGPQYQEFTCECCGQIIERNTWFYSVRDDWQIKPDDPESKNIHYKCWGKWENEMIEGGSK